MFLIVGLGNPGKKYERTKHDVGFLVLDELARQLHLSFREKRSMEAEIAKGLMDEKEVLLVKPQTFMNASGRSVHSILSHFHLDEDQLLIVYDDADLPFGTLRLRKNGSSGGHRGMASILAELSKHKSVARLRIGIGRPSDPDEPLDAYVLKPWKKQQVAELPRILDEAVKHIMDYVRTK